MSRHEYNAHKAMREAAMIEPRLASVRAMQTIRAQQRAKNERRARWMCVLILASALPVLFVIFTSH